MKFIITKKHQTKIYEETTLVLKLRVNFKSNTTLIWLKRENPFYKYFLFHIKKPVDATNTTGQFLTAKEYRVGKKINMTTKENYY